MDIKTLWGTGEQLLPLQMALRAFIMFLILLVLIRLGGVRMFGKKSALDHIIVIMLGAVAARGVVGASPFFATVAAGAVLVFTNWLLAYSSRKSKRWGKLVKGTPFVLYHEGAMQWQNIAKSNVGEEDIKESLRLETKQEHFGNIEKILIENNGRISFVMKKEADAGGKEP